MSVTGRLTDEWQRGKTGQDSQFGLVVYFHIIFACIPCNIVVKYAAAALPVILGQAGARAHVRAAKADRPEGRR